VVRLKAIALIVLAAGVPLVGDDGHHHDDLSEQQLGAVHFPTSCAPGVQKSFERGVALLHSFAFETAQATFRQVAEEDPRCAMAHWGIANTFTRWGAADSKQLERGWQEIKVAKSLHAQTARERAYIAAEAAFYEHSDDPMEKRS
jgi:hypothetical protein